MYLPEFTDYFIVFAFDVDQPDVLKEESDHEHTDEGGQGGERHQPASEVSRDAQDGEPEQLAARSRGIAHHSVNNAPTQEPYE
jgi:hypothetical protein